MITRRHFLSSCAVTAATPGAVAAATITDPFNITVTTGLIPVNRTTLWQPGVTYNTIPGASSPGIPNRTTIYKTLSPLGGGRDDGAQINAAMASCPPNQVVQLTAGVFNLLTNINSRTGNITLRGVGPGKGLATGNGGVFVPDPTATQLYYGNTTQAWGPPVTMNGNDTTQTYSNIINLTADAVQGTYSCTLASNPGIVVGEFVRIDQNTDNDSDVWWGPNHSGPGGISRSWFMRQDRSLGQILEVTAVNGNTIRFATPFHHTYSVAGTAQLCRFQYPLLVAVGLEDLYVGFGTAGGNGNIIMGGCAYSWIKNVESHWSQGGSVVLSSCYRCELRDSYIHETPTPNPGGGGYLIALNWGSSDCLVENCISWYGNKNIVMQATGGGNVIAYNYMDDSFGLNYPNLPEAGLNAAHQTTSHMELLEGNYSFKYTGDAFWGNVIDITVFRNHLSNIRAAHPPLNTYVVGGIYPYIDDGTRTAVYIQTHCYRTNLVGNVLGKQGQTLLSYSGPGWSFAQTSFAYEDLATIGDGSVVNMYYIGEIQGGGGGISWDPTTYQTQLRQGNWDWYTKSQTWYKNPIGASGDPGDGTPQPIPNSLYLTSKPAFFGSNPWPWVDPSTGTTYTLPAKARFDAGTPNTI